MPSLDTDNNLNGIDRRSPPLPSAVYNPSDSGDYQDDFPQLTNNVYKPGPPQRPTVSTNFSSRGYNVPSLTPQDDSPDPHDFYRVGREGYDRGMTATEISQSRKGSGGSQRSYRSRPTSPRSKHDVGNAHPPISSRISNARHALSSNQERSPLSATRSTPTFSNAPRNRQTSLQELVNKFNQTPDEVPPLPDKSSSRSPSASSSIRAPLTRSGTNSLTKTPSRGYSGSFSSDTPGVGGSRVTNQRRGRADGDAPGSPKSKKNFGYDPSKSAHVKPLAPSSMVDIAPEISSLPRKPLFGELFSSNHTQAQPGYGIPRPKRRRGSEGSMHSPTSIYPDPGLSRHREPSPSSPAAWYYGHTPPLEEIKAKGSIPDPPPNVHRRIRSESQSAITGPTYSHKYTNNLSPPSSPPPPANTSRRSSQSRIPISTRRISASSDTAELTPSPQSHPRPDSRNTRPSTRNRAPPPKPLQTTRTSPRYSRSNTPQKSPRYQANNSRTASSPRLAAYISEPLPKKSPPLRSSRPRQPVSSASTSASRARVVEKFSTKPELPRQTRESRPRRLPELGAVDFAARRQKIQQAFTKTVKEEEEREIRRMSMALEVQNLASPEIEDDSIDTCPTTDPPPKSLPQASTNDQEKPHPIQEEPKGSDTDLMVNTSRLPERSVLDLDDSPTLGTFNTTFAPAHQQHPNSGSSPNSDIEPGSAITAGTSDSVDTFFDDEPQDGSYDSSRRPSTAQPTLLSNVMTIRSSRSPSPEAISRVDGVEDKDSGDDRESIQIMLKQTPILEKQGFHDDFEDRSKEAQSSEDPDSRWSMSTWTSSLRSSDERDSQLERIEETEDGKIKDQAHLSVSSSASEPAQPAWSPVSHTSPKTDRTTMDSEPYGTINRVLDQYQDFDASRRDTAQDAPPYPYNQSPDLMRQGGYDPRKVTQLYLQRIAQERNVPSKAKSDAVKVQINKRTSSLPMPPPASEKEVRTDMDEKILPTPSHNRNLSATSAADHDIDDDGNLKPARASLSRPDDFDISPSLGGFTEMAADTPQEEKPPLPEKDAPFVRAQRPTETYDNNVDRYRRADDESRPQLPPMNFGQSLDIKVDPPHRGPSPVGPANSSRPAAGEYWDAPRSAPPLPPSKPSDATSHSRDLQSIPTDSTSKASSPSPDQKRLTRRRNIIKELVDTEHSFGQDMKVVEDIYKGTSNVIIISAEDVKTLFGNSDQIVSFSADFLDALKQAAKPVYVLSKSKRWKSNRVSNATSYSTTGDESSINGVELSEEEKDVKTFVGETFGHHMANMEKVYTEYLKNHDAANQKLLQLQKNTKVQIWLKECKAYASDLTTAWDLDSLLVKPVQRILKYPLLLGQLLEVTPENHPDYTALEVASREMKSVSMRINESKKRTDLLEQVTGTNRKRKESDMRTGLARAFGAGKKLRQQVGATNSFEDKEFNTIADKFSEHFVRLQIIMRDVEMYGNDVEMFMKKFLDFAMAIEAHIDVGQTSFPELESKWRKFRMSMRDMLTMALPEHVEQIQKHVVQPMQTLVKLHEGPQKLMQKRNKRLPDYARFKANMDRGDKVDKKTAEQGEQFLAVNETLKLEVPKLFELTSKLMNYCLTNFVQLQYKWLRLWKLKLKQAIDIPSATQDGDIQGELSKLVKAFHQDFAFYEGQVASLAACNGALLHETPNLVPFASPATSVSTAIGDPVVPGDGVISPRTGPSFDSRRTHSVSSEQSPILPQPDFGADTRGTGGFFPIGDTSTSRPAAHYQQPTSTRNRAASNVSNNTTPQTPHVPGSWRSFSNSTTPVHTTPGRYNNPPTRPLADPSPSLRPSMESSRMYRLSDESALTRPSPGTSYTQSSNARSNSPSANRFSGYFSSAMPMSDSPPSESPTHATAKDYNVIFLAASVYEFNIDKARKEAGYPYLTYVAGEIFDVIGEKGELWLAKNQDDRTNLVGWIWNKHFVKLAG